MHRGFINEITNIPAYKAAPKTWHVTVDKVKYFWYELVMGEAPPVPGIKDPVGEYLRKFKAEVDATLEKHFIYFLVTRPKIRINLKQAPKWGMFSKTLTVSILIGEAKREDSFVVKFNVGAGVSWTRPEVRVTDKYVTFDWGVHAQTYTVHDLMQVCQTGPDLPTKVQYVGKTKDPKRRLTTGEHKSIEKIHYRLGADNDLFLRVHTMKVGLRVAMPGLQIVTANSMVDEVPLEEENAIIECALIKYFNSQMQQDNVEKELGELRNQLREMRDHNNINRIVIDLELDNPNFYDNLFSDSVTESWRHVFECQLVDDEPRFKRLPDNYL